MAELLLIGALGAYLALVYCLFRALQLFGSWRPAAAIVWRSDYTEAQRSDDFWSFGFTIGTLRGFNWRDGDHARLIEDEIRFTATDGREHRAMVQRRVRRGWTPSSSYVVWYDPADPVRVTAQGPSFWLLHALLLLVLIGLLIQIWNRIGIAF
ncbi:hypothetical protein [Novosphingobium sp.]|uniref:hypothetical protein n=1 Tax=Novosphingobium sp. TaxID=1874826 RepID=UPI003BAC4E41